MTVADLLRSPKKAIPELLVSDPDPWFLPLAGYFFLSFAEGHGNMSDRFPSLGYGLILLISLLVSVLGSFLAAGLYGGSLHVSARLLGGKPGLTETVRAVGYALFWPGLVAFPCAAGFVAMLHGATRPSPAVWLPALGNVAAGIWAVITVVGALRAHHSFSRSRAILAWLTPILLLIPVVLLILYLRQPG